MAKAVVSTKEQERKALEQIKKIVDDLGADSYIGMAFEGCFEIAEENIANDFGWSMKQRAESAGKKCDELRKLNAGLEKRNTELEQEVINAKDLADTFHAECETRRQHICELGDQIDEYERKADEWEMERLKHKSELHDRDMQIMELKAKLYDLLVKE